ncbi:PREDICTED: protein argonaute-3 [Rhagoletis zephyria]|uniref:protein argonaute-3 n=1 Tax=Rhagoletis zephyria TaxID=28612 RepID=UPI000811208C|nr:PREDICTED: protein argonaute-3 [Rhagoletis zephyria]XP_017481988.1 PREDICTED: protein argonaute-3 [Rhagoletis zephyria]XP_017481989.1 PREDICTED: protein argonaute-3 [Rhagoletis zephyria]XP_017481990.1 PREDICTED: protein argonaute-3 [Rhagoletis zephyria]XP_017481991.1 PREDICTED: protein argonaute-3 [Rhagoletis zephyria]XP_017481992.1 PREDICTED: protein argonaute-3 [Rhagoletis zephyria]XP_017481994.1 PREDICTED: protein argonaute-3 [Rhagoletis zephyria]
MAARGRGFLLSLKTEKDSTDGDSSLKDSGLGSKSLNSGGEYRRVGRGRLLDDLASSCTNMTLEGRSSDDTNQGNITSTTDSNKASLFGGRGRANVFKTLFTDEPAEPKLDTQPVPVSVPVPIRAPVPMPVPEPEPEKEVIQADIYNPELKHGNKGMPVRLACNYIRLSSDPEKGVFVYEVRFHPPVDSLSLRMKYLNEHRDKFGGTKTFDGVTLYLPILLKDKLTTFLSKNVADNSDIEIRILFKRKEALKNCIHLYNVLFDRVMKTLNYVRFDRKQFDPTAPKVIPQAKLEVWPGYVTAIDEYEGGLMLCCDVSHRLLCQKTVLETLVEIYRSNPNMFQENAKKYLLGSRYNNRTYRIDDICFEKNPKATFQTKQAELSYIDYYKQSHNILIKDETQPLIISIKKQKTADKQAAEDLVVCLIPELCYLTGLRDDIRSDYKLMREIATFTRVSPNQRLLALEKFFKNVNSCPEAQKILECWGLNLKNAHEYLNGRQFEEEKIMLGKKQFGAGVNADFSKYVGNNEVLEVVHLSNWILFHCKTDSRCAKNFYEHVDRNSRALGIRVDKPKIVILDNDRVDTYVKALRTNIDGQTQIVVCISPTNRDDRYAAIKKVCCAEIPIPSQVINARTLLNEAKNRSIVQKIMLQMNCKLGGSLWAVKIPFKNVMICGIDSYHDAAQKGNSVAAFVASLNQNYTKWYSKAVIQGKREEIVNGLCSSFTAAVTRFHRENGVFPDNIIIYRDGVGDGQLPLCSGHEIPQLEAACKRAFKDYAVKITFIVVQKRINTRYFSTNGSNVDNPPPGTVVDNVITRSKMYDFYLVSQTVRQGTVTPAHYIVLRDDAKYSPDIIQRLTYKLCFMYYNWPGTIRIPACCQYAHKMAYLIGQSIRRATSEELSDRLFYL